MLQCYNIQYKYIYIYIYIYIYMSLSVVKVSPVYNKYYTVKHTKCIAALDQKIAKDFSGIWKYFSKKCFLIVFIVIHSKHL